MRKILLSTAAALVLSPVGAAFADLTAYTSATSFFAAIAGYDQNTEDFEGTPAGTTVSPGGSIGALTFSYDFGGALMAVTDGDEFGGSLPAPTTSPTNFLATNDADLFQGGDDFTMTFAAANAVGLYIVSAEVPNDTIFDGDLTLSAAGIDAILDIDDLTDLGDDSYAYFLGIVDTMGTFTTASLTAASLAIGAMTYVIDDITLATKPTGTAPVPATALLLASGLLGVGALRRHATKR